MLGQQYRHNKSGGVYQIVCFADMEVDLSPMVVYQHVVTGRCWIRPYHEFFDGRFTLVKSEFVFNSGIGGGR